MGSPLLRAEFSPSLRSASPKRICAHSAACRDAQPPLAFGLKKDAAACHRVCSRFPMVVFPRAELRGILLDINQSDVHINPSAQVTPQLLELYNS